MTGEETTLTAKQAAEVLGVSTRILKRINEKGLLTKTISGSGKNRVAVRYHYPLKEVLGLKGKINPKEYRLTRKPSQRYEGLKAQIETLAAQVMALAAQVR